jgi:hypothetical protein
MPFSAVLKSLHCNNAEALKFYNSAKLRNLADVKLRERQQVLFLVLQSYRMIQHCYMTQTSTRAVDIVAYELLPLE